MDRVILHSDMNNCYASIELLHHPELRGRPLAVGGDPEARHGIVLAKDQLAKKAGVKTGMALWQAREVCPEIQFVPPRMDLYLRFSRLAHEIYGEYTDKQEAFGVDESWLDVTDSCSLKGDGMTIAAEISRRIKKELGITVSIGVSNNKVTAKLGSDYKNPDAVTRIEQDNYEAIVYPLPVEDLLYVGPATKRKLNYYGIRTIGQLAEISPEVLAGWFGKVGYSLSSFARGTDRTPVSKQDYHAAVKSVGNSGTTPRDLVSDEDVWLMLIIMAESVAMRMRELGMKCTVVEVSVRDSDLSGFTRQRKINTPTNGSLEIARIAYQLFKQNYHWERPLRSVGVRAASLVTEDCAIQLDLFSGEAKRESLERLDRAVDVVRARYGYTCIQRAVVYTDKELGRVNPKDDHTIHPVGFFNAG